MVDRVFGNPLGNPLVLPQKVGTNSSALFVDPTIVDFIGGASGQSGTYIVPSNFTFLRVTVVGAGGGGGLVANGEPGGGGGGLAQTSILNIAGKTISIDYSAPKTSAVATAGLSATATFLSYAMIAGGGGKSVSLTGGLGGVGSGGDYNFSGGKAGNNAGSGGGGSAGPRGNGGDGGSATGGNARPGLSTTTGGGGGLGVSQSTANGGGGGVGANGGSGTNYTGVAFGGASVINWGSTPVDNGGGLWGGGGAPGGTGGYGGVRIELW